MSNNDWDTVTVLKKKPLKAAQMKTESAINQASKSNNCYSLRTTLMANTIQYFLIFPDDSRTCWDGS